MAGVRAAVRRDEVAAPRAELPTQHRSRADHGDALTTTERGRPDNEQMRRALTGWAFNVGASTGRTPPDETRRALAWLERNTRPVSDLGKPAVARAVLDALDLRHAAVSAWLNAGVPPTQVAAWAGHSVAVLLTIYAKCLVGQEDAARCRIDVALGGP